MTRGKSSKALGKYDESSGAEQNQVDVRGGKGKVFRFMKSKMAVYEEATDQYLRNCQAVGKSAITVDCYRKTLGYFYNFMLDDPARRRKGPCFVVAQEWRDELIASASVVTARLYLIELHTFFKWASDKTRGKGNVYYKQNPVPSSLIPDMPKESGKPYDILLTDDEIAALYMNREHIDQSHLRYWPRNYAIVVFIMATGLRNAEVLDLRLSDVDFDYNEVTVRSGKGNKFRVVDLPQIAKTALELYLASGLRPDSLSDTDYLFGTTGEPKRLSGTETSEVTWKRGTSQWLSAMIERHVRNVVGVEGIRSHDLRHICARMDLNSGMRMEELQAKLGHSNPNTTQIYSGRLMPRRARESAQRVMDARDKQAKRNEQMLARIVEEKDAQLRLGDA